MPQLELPLPEFDSPPVSEVAISVQFTKPSKWNMAQAGIFWDTVVAEYPNIQVQAPLPPQVEKFGSEMWSSHNTLNVQLMNPDAVARYWLLTPSENDLVQIQNDRFIVNWRKVKGDEEYPRFGAKIRPRFIREWERFRNFIARRELGEISVEQCELVYVNDIPRDHGWSTFSDLHRIFSICPGKTSDNFLPELDTIALKGSFAMPNERGRLHFSIQHLQRQIDDKEVIQLTLTARGRPISGDEVDILAWIDSGREWIVRGFSSLTTPEAHKLWKRSK